MNNNELLQKRWGEVDEILSTFYSKNEKINRNMYNRIQDILNSIDYSYDNLYKYATTNDVKKFRSKVEEIKDKYELKGYTGYTINNLYKRSKLRNSEILMGLLSLAYYEQMQEQNKAEKKLFDELVNKAYIEGQEEALEVLNKKSKIKPLPRGFVAKMGGFNGYKWQDYKEGNISYSAKQLFQAIAIDLQKNKKLDTDNENIKKTLKKHFMLYLALAVVVEDVKKYITPFYGALDNQITYLVNQAILQGAWIQGCREVKFIAVLDEKTTKMCKSLDGQIFKIKGMNKFKRYSQSSDGIVQYKQKGLVVGLNLPPIMDNYHHCRSTIYPESKDVDNKQK